MRQQSTWSAAGLPVSGSCRIHGRGSIFYAEGVSRARLVMPRRIAAQALPIALAACGSAGADGGDPCRTDDVDGINGGDLTFQLSVDEVGFSPAILTAQDTARITLTVANA